MSGTLSTGIPYHIRSSVYSGGYLGLRRGESGQTLRLNAYLPSDDSQNLWIFQSPDGDGFSIQNAQYLGLYASERRESDVIWSMGSEVLGYRFIEANATSYYRICRNANCWVPFFHSAGEPRDNDYVVIRPSGPSPGEAYEVWEVIPAGDVASSASTAPSSSTTTSALTSTSQSDSMSSSTYHSTSTQQDSPAQTSQATQPSDLQALKECAPCGKARCTFSPSGASKKATYSILIGQPVSNCHNKSQEITTTKLGGTFELQETFSVEATVSAGLGLLGPSISTTVGHSESKKIVQTQEIEVSIRPGQIGALIANVSYTTQPGQVSVDDSTLAFVSIQPDFILGYSVVYTDCDSDFQALAMPKVECSSAGSRMVLTTKMVVLWMVLGLVGVLVL